MTAGVEPIVFYLIIFVLAIFVGYHVVWSVTPALHTPLMSVTNAISAIILVGAMLAAGPAVFDWGEWVGVAAVVMASINAFGGFLVTQRMLEMFKRKSRRRRRRTRSDAVFGEGMPMGTAMRTIVSERQ